MPTLSTAVETLTRPTTTLRASTTCSPTVGTSRSPTMTVVEKFLKTSPRLTSWVTTHGDPVILSPETVQLPTLVVKVVSLHGTATTTDIRTDLVTQGPLTDTCTTCTTSGLKDHSPTQDTQVTTTTRTSSDSAGAKLTRTRAHPTVPTHTTTGVTTTTPTTVDRVSTSQLKATTDTADTTTSVSTMHTATTCRLAKVLECPSQSLTSAIHRSLQ